MLRPEGNRDRSSGPAVQAQVSESKKKLEGASGGGGPGQRGLRGGSNLPSERNHRPANGPLRPDTITHIQDFLHCGDLAAGFTRFLCPGCGHQHLLAFTCKSRHFCPACHQRRTLHTGAWIATSVCQSVPHRQFVFTIPKMLRGIFRKRRHPLHLIFQTATDTLRDAFRTRLNLPHGRLAAASAVHTFGDYLIFHPHLHILAADGLFDKEGRFHCMPAADLGPMTELFRHRFLQVPRDGKHLSARKVADLLSWKHSGFHIDSGGQKPIAPDDTDGRKRLAEYLLRAPFSLQKMTCNPDTKTVIYRSRRSWHTKRNFEVFKFFRRNSLQKLTPAPALNPLKKKIIPRILIKTNYLRNVPRRGK